MESNKAGPKSVGLNTPMGSSPILNIKNFDDGGESNDRPPPMITQSDDDDSSDDKDENNDGKPPPIARRRSTQLRHYYQRPNAAMFTSQQVLYTVLAKGLDTNYLNIPNKLENEKLI